MTQEKERFTAFRRSLLGVTAGVLLGFTTSASAEDVEMRIGLIYNPNVPAAKCGAIPMAEDPALKDLGIKINVVHSAQLGGENDMAQQVSSGELEMSLSASSILASWLEDLSVFETYYLYDNVDQAFAAYKTDTAKKLFKELRDVANIQVIGTPWLYGERHVFGNKPLRKPEDFKGVKMRVPQTSVSIAGAQSLGASPTPTAYAELYLALQQGIVDVAEAPASVVKAESFDEPSKYFNKTGHLISAAPVYLNGTLWDSLSPEQQQALEKAVDAAAERIRKCVEEADQEAYASWKQAGTPEIIEDVDREALKAQSRAFFSQGFPFSESYKALIEELKQY